MTITLPITLAIISVLLVEVADALFAMPLASVEEAIVLDEALVRTIEGREVMTLRGATLPADLPARDRLFRPAIATPEPARSQRVRRRSRSVGERRLGFVVDELVGQQDIVIKALGKSLKGVRGFAGATELGDQRVALVLDVAALIEEVLAPRRGALPRRRWKAGERRADAVAAQASAVRSALGAPRAGSAGGAPSTSRSSSRARRTPCASRTSPRS